MLPRFEGICRRLQLTVTVERGVTSTTATVDVH